MPDLPAEFAFIARHFRPLAGAGALDLQDDAALLLPVPGTELVLAADAMVESVHFLTDDPPRDLGRKLLRVNLSDLAAMGADPVGYLLTLCVPPRCDDRFFEDFSNGLAADQAEFGITLLGGDTTSTAGPLSMSLTVVGRVPRGAAVRRNGARPGDGLFVTGTIGDGALGLLALRGEVADPGGYLADRYHLPRPRLGLAIRGLARAAIDVSDGLLQDAMHLCRASGVSVRIDAAKVPLSPAARAAGPAHRETCLAGGDDYELLIAAGDDQAEALRRAASDYGCALTQIGVFQGGPPALVLLDEFGKGMTVDRHGFSHF
jgi:thiamine-monophosphate kinase